METIIIMTEVYSPYGKYIEFMNKDTRERLGEVDTCGRLYKIFYGAGRFELIATRTNRDSAIRHLQKTISAGIQGTAKFRWNVMTTRIKYA